MFRASDMKQALFAACILGLLGGCATEKPIDPWIRDKDAVVARMQIGEEQQTAQSQQIQELTRQLIKVQRSDKKQSSQLAAMEASFQALRERLGSPVVIHRIPQHAPTSSHKPSPAARKMEQKINRATQAITHTIEQTKQPVTPTVQPTAPPSTTQRMKKINSVDEKNSYTAAYLALKSGRFEEASKQFEAHLVKFSQGSLTDQSLYWLGESYLAQQQPDKAKKAFSTLIRSYPTSSKFSASLMRLGLIYQQDGHKAEAKAAYLQLIQNQPNSSIAEQARARLKALKQKPITATNPIVRGQ
ncbi:MAG: tol-pal system protein YbgF [Mariprofundales bacterium]|nr:tol-pal system protein YbgF [Mariprofundales bacterium]